VANLTLPKPPLESHLSIEKLDEGAIRITIETERLRISPVCLADVEEYSRFLFGNSTVMEKFASGKVRTTAFVEEQILNWVKRWESGDPFGAFTIRLRSGEFVGHIVLGHGDKPGHSEVAYLIRDDFWSNGYGSEAARHERNYYK
jgi:RimJ/RimL family protein N-acetyltransferase